MMSFEKSYHLSVPADAAWTIVGDVETLVPCLPGASVESVNNNDFTGRVAIKVGPIQVKYRGRGTVTERDESTRTLSIRASGSESTGTGTASAEVSARLEPDGPTSRMHVAATFEVTGTPARFGSSAMNEVAERIVQKFAANLTAAVAAGSQSNGVAPDMSHEMSPALQGQLSLLDLLPTSWLRHAAVAAAFLVGLAIAILAGRARLSGRSRRHPCVGATPPRREA